MSRTKAGPCGHSCPVKHPVLWSVYRVRAWLHNVAVNVIPVRFHHVTVRAVVAAPVKTYPSQMVLRTLQQRVTPLRACPGEHKRSHLYELQQ